MELSERRLKIVEYMGLSRKLNSIAKGEDIELVQGSMLALEEILQVVADDMDLEEYGRELKLLLNIESGLNTEYKEVAIEEIGNSGIDPKEAKRRLDFELKYPRENGRKNLKNARIHRILGYVFTPIPPVSRIFHKAANVAQELGTLLLQYDDQQLAKKDAIREYEAAIERIKNRDTALLKSFMQKRGINEETAKKYIQMPEILIYRKLDDLKDRYAPWL